MRNEEPQSADPFMQAGNLEAPHGPSRPGEFEAAEQFLTAMVKILRDRGLYPAGHKQVHAGLVNLDQIARNLFLDRNRRTFVFIDDQVYVDDRLLIGLGGRQEQVAGLFREKQIEALTLHQGISRAELQSFLDHLTCIEGGERQRPVFQAPHLEIGYLSLRDLKNQGGSPPSQGATFGILQSRSVQDSFSDQALRLQDIYSDWNRIQKALVPYVDRIIQSLEKSLFSNFHSFIPLADLKSYDEYTYVHAINLCLLTMAQAEFLHLSKELVHAYGIGALLHDVGKTKVSLHILNKKAKLTPEELEEMKTHPVHGAALILQHREIPRVAAIVAYEHHLRYDCTGYPALKQKRPQHIAAKLTAISDHFDAMRSHRPHQAALEQDRIFEIMQENKGKSLDPDLVDRFICLINSRRVD